MVINYSAPSLSAAKQILSLSSLPHPNQTKPNHHSVRSPLFSSLLSSALSENSLFILISSPPLTIFVLPPSLSFLLLSPGLPVEISVRRTSPNICRGRGISKIFHGSGQHSVWCKCYIEQLNGCLFPVHTVISYFDALSGFASFYFCLLLFFHSVSASGCAVRRRQVNEEWHDIGREKGGSIWKGEKKRTFLATHTFLCHHCHCCHPSPIAPGLLRCSPSFEEDEH